MSIHAVIAELKEMYRAALEGTSSEISRLSDDDIRRWSANLAIARGALYDKIALNLARGFYKRELPFWFCDRIVNDIHKVIMDVNEDRPKLFWSIFLAFDAGEYYHEGKRSEDPVATYTRPLIAKIVEGQQKMPPG